MKRSTFDEDLDTKEYENSKRHRLDKIVEEEMLEDIENESFDEKLLNICILGFTYNKVDASYIENNVSKFKLHTYHAMLAYRHRQYDVLICLLMHLPNSTYDLFLLRAIKDNEVELVKLFVENDNLEFRVYCDSENPLIVSAEYGRREITEYLYGKDKFSKDVVKIFSFLCRDGIIDLVEKILPLIIELPNKSVLLTSGLAYAIEHKHEDIIDLILKQEFTIFIKAFKQACISYSSPGLLKKIIKKGDSTHYYKYYNFCLNVAFQYSHYDIVDYILEKDAKLLNNVDLTIMYEYWDGSERMYFKVIPDGNEQLFNCLIGLAKNRKINTYKKFVELYNELENAENTDENTDETLFCNVFVGGNIEIFKIFNRVVNRACVKYACMFKNIDIICFIIPKIFNPDLLVILADYNMLETVYDKLSTESKKHLRNIFIRSPVLAHGSESTKRFIVERIFTREFMLRYNTHIMIEQLIDTRCFKTVGWIFNGYVFDGTQNPENIIVRDNFGNYFITLNIRMDIRMCANLMDGKVNVRSEYVQKLENYRIFLIRREVLKLYNKKLPVEIVDKIISYIPYMPNS
jgi:hypothetical protein